MSMTKTKLSSAGLKSSQAFFQGMVDYAGLFPPAKLPLEEALDNYREYRKMAEAGLLNRFIFPIGKLEDLKKYPRGFRAKPLRLSLVGQGGDNLQEIQERLLQDLEALKSFLKECPWAQAEALELPLPLELSDPHENVKSIQKVLIDNSLPFLNLSLEIQPPQDPFPLAAAIAKVNDASPTGVEFVGLKLRCGGLTKEAFPSQERLVDVVMACRDAGCPWKATAGLHHPFPNDDEVIGVRRHGFLNVMAAALMAVAYRMDEDQLGELLQDGNAENFRFDGEGFHWRHYSVAKSNIAFLRRYFFTGFGSCSFLEPLDDLKELGWIA